MKCNIVIKTKSATGQGEEEEGVGEESVEPKSCCPRRLLVFNCKSCPSDKNGREKELMTKGITAEI